MDITRDTIAAKKSLLSKGKKTTPDALDALRGEIDALRARERNLVENPQKPLRLFAQDCTPEKLGRLLQDNGETLSLISDEGGFFTTLTGKRYSETVNLDCLLNAYTLSSVQSARVTSDDVDLERPCLNIVAACQPITVEDLTSNRVYNRRGLTARFLYAFDPPKEKPPGAEDPQPPWDEAVDNYNNLIRDLLSLSQDYDERGKPAPRIIVFSDEAMKMRRALEIEAHSLIADLRKGDPFAYWLERYHAHAVRLAGIFHVCEHRNEADAVELSPETFQKALELARYFKAHAEHAFSLSGAPMTEAEQDALYIWKRIRESGQDQIAKRDLIRLCRRFKNAEAMDPGINALSVEHDYIRIVTSGEGRGRKSVTIEVNPEAKKEK